MDEALLAQSAIAASLKEILQANLPANQAAPLGFVLSFKALSYCFGYSEYVLRIIPLLAGILIFPIAYFFALREFDKKFACIFLFFLTISTPLLFYSIQFKQYATEILVSLIYLNSFCKNRKTIIEEAKIPLGFTIIVLVGMLFSNASIFVLAGLFFTAFFEQWKIKQIKLFLLNNWLKIVIIVAFLLCYYLLWLNQIKGVNNGFMDNFWKNSYLGKINLIILLQTMLGYFIAVSYNWYLNCILFASLFIFGSIFLFKEKRCIFFAIITGITFYLIAYLFGKYPIAIDVINNYPSSLKTVGSRFFVHFFPIVLIVPSYAIFKLLESDKFKKLAFLLLITMPCFTFYFSYKNIASGLEIVRISELIETIEEENSAILMEGATTASYSYYKFLTGKNFGNIYLLSSLPPSDFFEIHELSLTHIMTDLPFNAIFEDLKNKGVKKAYFIFSYIYDSSYTHQLAAVNNFPSEKTSIYEAHGVQAILVELE
jgi:hypothetical protein